MTSKEAAVLVRRYLSDCKTWGRLLNPDYHPTEAGALKIIYHGPPRTQARRANAEVIKNAYREAVRAAGDGKQEAQPQG